MFVACGSVLGDLRVEKGLPEFAPEDAADDEIDRFEAYALSRRAAVC